MKKLQVLNLVLFSVFALTALFAAAAMATPGETLPAEWLVNGAAVTGDLLFNIDYEILELLSGFDVDMLCSRAVVGTYGARGQRVATLVEDLEGHDVTGTSTQKWNDCIVHIDGSCEEHEGTSLEVFPLHLPWEGLVELIVDEKGEEVFVDLLVEGSGGKPGFLVECKVLGVKGDATCTGEFGELLENGTSDVTSNATESDKIITPNLHCTTPLGEGEGETESFGGLMETAEGTLSVSSP